MTWFEAKDYCESMDAYLAEALNSETQNFLETHAKSLPPMNWWLGAIDQVSFFLNSVIAYNFNLATNF